MPRARNDQHGTGRFADDAGRDAPEHEPHHRAEPARAEHEQVHTPLRALEQLAGRLALLVYREDSKLRGQFRGGVVKARL